MPWNNQSGGGKGPWGGDGDGAGGGGPWSGSSGSGGPNRPNPWGDRPGRGPESGGSPDLEELFRRSQDKLKRVLPRRGGSGGSGGGGPSISGIGGRGIALAAVAAAILYGLTGFYRVGPGQLGVELVFGEPVGNTLPGLNYNWPYPVGQVYTPDVLRVNEVNVGTRGDAAGRSGTDVPEESLMLTGDENIIDVDFKVQWQINRDRPEDFLFNVEDPQATVKQVAESAMREVVGRRNIQPILTQERGAVEIAVRDLMQQTLNGYQAGIEITQVQMQKVDPPSEVIDAFRDVQAARADQVRLQNEADSYANSVVPKARGESAQILEQANGYRDQIVAEATGQASRFVSVYDEYKLAPEVVRQRMYLETMERVLAGTDKVILDQSGTGPGVVPYLPLDRIDAARPAGGTR